METDRISGVSQDQTQSRAGRLLGKGTADLAVRMPIARSSSPGILSGRRLSACNCMLLPAPLNKYQDQVLDISESYGKTESFR